MNIDPIEYTIKATDESVESYVIGKEHPSIVLNHLRRFTSLIPIGGTILDLGCGHGRDVKYFEDRGYTVVGVDRSEKMLEKAREVCRDDAVLINMDVRDITSLNMSFDSIWSCAVVHHIPNYEIYKLLCSVNKSLQMNGVFYCSFKIDNAVGYVYRKDLNVSKYYEYYTIDEFTGYLSRFGFEIIETIIEDKAYRWVNFFCKKVKEI